jgi:hypothetical protein
MDVYSVWIDSAMGVHEKELPKELFYQNHNSKVIPQFDEIDTKY